MKGDLCLASILLTVNCLNPSPKIFFLINGSSLSMSGAMFANIVQRDIAALASAIVFDALKALLVI